MLVYRLIRLFFASKTCIFRYFLELKLKFLGKMRPGPYGPATYIVWGGEVGYSLGRQRSSRSGRVFHMLASIIQQAPTWAR